jgi:hypothetical protein
LAGALELAQRASSELSQTDRIKTGTTETSRQQKGRSQKSQRAEVA